MCWVRFHGHSQFTSSGWCLWKHVFTGSSVLWWNEHLQNDMPTNCTSMSMFDFCTSNLCCSFKIWSWSRLLHVMSALNVNQNTKGWMLVTSGPSVHMLHSYALCWLVKFKQKGKIVEGSLSGALVNNNLLQCCLCERVCVCATQLSRVPVQPTCCLFCYLFRIKRFPLFCHTIYFEVLASTLLESFQPRSGIWW